MKKVGLLTIFSVPNYGSVLQTYATQILLENLGYNCDIINYDRDNNWYYSHGSYKYSLKNKIGQFFMIKPTHRKNYKLCKFRKKFLNLSRRYESLEDLEHKDWSGYYAFIVGSDQVWNTKFSYGDLVYLLAFVPEDVRKISLASSFALDKLATSYIDKFKKYLSRFSCISVRELNGKSIIQNQLGLNVDVEILLDPTLLISKEMWLKVIPRSNFRKREKYILLYMLDYAFKPQPYIYDVAEYFQKKFGYSIYVLEGSISKDYKKKLRINKVYNSSVFDFIDYFNNADIILTSSFHGTAFALNFGKPLISIVPDGGDDRQTSILKELHLSDLVINVGSDIDKISPFYDVVEEQDILSKLRNKSVEWLSTALKN